jgi:hypothetical protein
VGSVRLTSDLFSYDRRSQPSSRFSSPSASAATASAQLGSAAVGGTAISRNQVRTPHRQGYDLPPPVLTPRLSARSMVSSHLLHQPPRERVPRRRSRAGYRTGQTPSYRSDPCPCPPGPGPDHRKDDAAHSQPKTTAAVDANDGSAPACWGVCNLDGVLGSLIADIACPNLLVLFTTVAGEIVRVYPSRISCCS